MAVKLNRMWKGYCRDEYCRQPLLFNEYDGVVCCHACGQNHRTSALDERAPVDPNSEQDAAIPKPQNLPPRPPDMVKVMSLSHYHQKLVSPLLTTHGMDKNNGKARPLRQLTGRQTLDCSVFGDRGFRIESRHLHINGFGVDESAKAYLNETLNLIKPYNDDKESLVPLHVDGDGHCLVHAISRSLVGRQLFWHPLRIGLKQHFNLNLDKYKSLLGNFINSTEWPCIIDECEPEYKPQDGSMVGLRNIHVFGLANLLRRPIILLDCVAGMKASADYAALFLPGLNPPMACSNKAGHFNPPICLAWSSAARNHYVPLVPVKELPLPRFPRHLLPKVWGFPQSLLDSYITFDDQNCLTIGSEATLAQPYFCKLTFAMDELFIARNGVPPAIVSDLYYYHYSNKLVTPPKPEMMVEVGATMLQERRLLRCLNCTALEVIPLNSHWLRPGGALYIAAKKVFGFLRENYEYSFTNYGITCFYVIMLDMLVVHRFKEVPCNFCQGSKLRRILPDGSVAYENGDKTLSPVVDTSKSRCKCGYKHFYNGCEYDSPPLEIPIEMEWKSKMVKDVVLWFYGESDQNLNSTLEIVVNLFLQKHFPNENKGDTALYSQVAEQIIEKTKFLTVEVEERVVGEGEEPSGARSPSRKRECSSPLGGSCSKMSRLVSEDHLTLDGHQSPTRLSPIPSTSRDLHSP